jgi:hypothetical protein
VRRDEFLGRKDELRTIFNRLRHTESTAIVGEPHIGKSSLILKLTEDETKQAYLADDAENTITSLLDLHPIGSNYTPTAFWQEALEPLEEQETSSTEDGAESTLSTLLTQARDAGYSRRTLEKLFNQLGKEGRRLALLLDEFERLLIHPNFQDPSFFALMRSLATRTGGLAMISTSRLSVAEMNERGRVLLETGSPFFNHTIEMRLHPFDKVTIGILLDRAGQAFSPDDRRFIRRVAGRHPFLLQAMAAVMLETSGEDRYEVAAERFYERTSSHFDDLWRTLDDRTRTASVILSLMELGGRALGDRFAYGEIEQSDAFGPELRKLEERGLAEQAGEGWQFDLEHLLLWQGEQWTVGTQAFVWWVRDVIITESRRVPAYDEWLANKRYKFLLTQEQWDLLVNTVRELPQWAVRGVAGLARSLVQELVGRK